MVIPWGFLHRHWVCATRVVCDSGPSFRNGKWLEQQLQGSRSQRSALSKLSVRVDCCSSVPRSLAVFGALKLFWLRKEKRPLPGGRVKGLCGGVQGAAIYKETSRSEHCICRSLRSRLDYQNIPVPRLLYLSLWGEKWIWGKHSNFLKNGLFFQMLIQSYANFLNFKSNVPYVLA